MDAQVAFIGKVVPSGKSVTVAADMEADEFETIHFTQVALGPKPAKGPHTIFIENEDGKFAVGTLDREKCTQFSMDITIACDDITISHTGESDVHLTGYRTVALIGSEDGDEYADGAEEGLMLYRKGGRGSSDDEDENDDEEEGDEDESEDDEPPRAVPLNKNNRLLVEDEASEGSEEEEEDDEEEEEDEDMEDSSEEEGSESESSDEEEEEEEDAPPSKNAKRKQAAAAAQTPQPTKKAKVADVATAPATAPAKVSTPNGESPANDKEFAAALKSFLQKNGPCKLSVLGSSVKRPPKSPKMKKLIEQNSNVFSFNPVTETVSLAK